MNQHSELLEAAQRLTAENPELHAEYTRRRQSGEAFAYGEPVQVYMRRLHSLNDALNRLF